MRCSRGTKLKLLTTAIAAGAWLAACAYLYAWWQGLAGALDLHVPRTAILALGVAAPIALRLKDCRMSAPRAVLVDALLAAPPLAAFAFLFLP